MAPSRKIVPELMTVSAIGAQFAPDLAVYLQLTTAPVIATALEIEGNGFQICLETGPHINIAQLEVVPERCT